MKRSELVTRIEEYLLHTEHLDIPCSLGSDFKAAAEELVVLIEKAGMLPPPKVIEAVTESLAYCYYNKVSEFKDIDGWYYFDRDNSQLWEPEDSTINTEKAIDEMLNALDNDKETKDMLTKLVPDGIKLK